MKRFSAMFERLENREVFSAGPVLGSLATLAGNAAAPSGHVNQLLPYVEQDNVFAALRTTQTGGQAGASALEFGRPDGTQQQIIAILIGLAYPPPGSTPHAGEGFSGAIDAATLDRLVTEFDAHAGSGDDLFDALASRATPRSR